MSRITLHNRIVVAIAFSLVSLLTLSASIAQSPENYTSIGSGSIHQPVSPFPVEMGFSQHHSSTALEGALRGKAAVIQAWGNFELADSQAQILLEQARSLDRENDLAQTAALHAQQKMWRDNRIQARKTRDSRVAEGRVILAARRATVYRDAYQLSPAELNAATGEISWPMTLRVARYEQDRARLDELFREHVSYGAPQDEMSREIARVVDRLTRTLQADIQFMPRDEYVAAQKFLKGLKYGAAALVQG